MKIAFALLTAGLLAACGEGRREPSPAVLLVTLDTTRADHLGAYGDTRRTTPQLDALAARAVLFARAYAVAPMTLPAHASLLTGRLPTRTGLRWNGEQKLTATVPTLAERFRDSGYSTAAFVSAAVLDRAFGLDRGFATYDAEVGAAGSAWKAERPGRETVRRALAWLAAQPADRPVFLWVHLFEPHEPYLPPEPFAARFPGDPYSAEIATADFALAPLLASARFAPGARAVVSVIGDHGESLGEHGEATHGILLYDGALRVPWLLVAPELGARRVDFAASQVDLAPTLLALAHLPALAAPTELDGTDLSGELRGGGATRARTLYAESLYGNFLYGWAALASTRREGFKWIAGGRSELFDTTRDPGETRNLAATSVAQAGALARALDEFRARESAADVPSAAIVDAALAEGLRSLGYLSGTEPRPELTAGLAHEDPRDRIALHERLRAIDAQWQRGDVTGAEQALDEVSAEDPGNHLVQRVIERQVRSAIGEFSQRAASEPGAGDVVLRLRIRLAQILAQQGRRDAARELLETAADSTATGAAALNVRAFARLELGRREEARADWIALLRIAPRDASPRLHLATLALGERRFDEAERQARAAVALAPRDPAAQNTLAIALDDLGRVAEAEAAYRAALALDPALFRSELNLALLLAGQAGRRADAVTHLSRYLAIAPAGDPREAEARALLARLSAAAGGGG